MEQIRDTYESANPFSDTLTKEEIIREIAKAYGPSPKLQKSEKLQSSKIDRLESKIDEIAIVDRKVIRKIIVSN
ncbi:13297_t:CDS:2 [Funneliformis geosporum]|uniref:13297_t:CDS:1 n=1 Tax=Funneliformis geosporum TaxID=1117311 RepID=A0A9W4SRP0_9GLOM|nr:13297_t:CDS:2 [Funneliformis geosporum]